jgi:transposase-like protein
LAAEKLSEEGLIVNHETLRRWLLEEGDWKKRRKRRAHRSRRERRAHFGALVQMDGSHHGWFGPGQPKACLMNMVDDATGITLGSMDAQETTEAAMLLLWRWIEKYGIPKALYTDKKSVYITLREATIEEQLADEVPLTAFGKACHKLGIEIIRAHSPQAKGRVERSNGTYQDRLVKELALRRITTCATTDALLKNSFCDALNEKFAQPPLEKNDYHRPLPKGLKLEDVFCFEELRKVQNDWCIRHKNRHYQILKDNRPLPKPKDKILVRTRLDGSTHLLYKDKALNFQAISPKQLHQQRQPPAKAKLPTPKAKTSQKAKKPFRANCNRLSHLLKGTA